MPDIKKAQAIWTGFNGAPGYTTLYFGTASVTIAAQMRVFFDAIKALLPSIVTIQVQSTGLTVDIATGAATGTWTEAAVTPVVGTTAGVYSAPSGAVVDWLTPSFINGRRLRGRSFIVPMASASYQNDGSILGTSLTILQNAASAFVAASAVDFVVWKRPVDGAGGVAVAVTSAIVPDKAVVLRSRRD